MSDRHRISTRAVIQIPDGRLLLFLSHFDPGSQLPPQWVFPGGGLEQNETPLDGIVREVFEETGRRFDAADFAPIAMLWHQMDDLRYHDTGEAHFFELQVPQIFEPSSEFWTENEHRDTVAHRWVTLSDIITEQLWLRPEGAIDLLIERYSHQAPQAPSNLGS